MRLLKTPSVKVTVFCLFRLAKSGLAKSGLAKLGGCYSKELSVPCGSFKIGPRLKPYKI